MRALDISQSNVLKCYDASFETEGDYNSNNMLLEKDEAVEVELGIFLHPGISINNITYKGYLEGEDIHNAVCASLRP